MSELELPRLQVCTIWRVAKSITEIVPAVRFDTYKFAGVAPWVEAVRAGAGL